MKVLADFHHDSLWTALHLLFEKRLGWELYRPFDMAWFDEGYFRLYGDLSKDDPYRWLAELYLKDIIFTKDGQTGYGLETRMGCIDYPRFNLASLKRAKEMDFDIVVCTINENEEYFAKFAKEFCPKAKLVRITGNMYDEVNHELYSNLMASDISSYEMYKGKHKVLFRQEFDLNLFKYAPPENTHNFYSFLNGLRAEETEPGIYSIWLELLHLLPEFKFKTYGGKCENGRIFSKRKLIEKMLEASFLYHVKRIDGYGHIIHNAFALGRPVVTCYEHYKGKMAEPLLEDGETAIFTDGRSNQLIADIIRKKANIEELTRMAENCRRRFEENVNFDEEFLEIKKFLEELV